MSNKSGTASQVITLPSGGGALSGIDETFAPDLHTGTGNFTVPIALPPGRNGFQPQLSLVYSTGNGNGPFGLGWNLSIPGVSRKTTKGVPRYKDGDDELKNHDTFILSGAEDLMPITDRDSEGVIHYRPRTEGLFAHIAHQQNATHDYWEVHSKDGLVSLYGTRGAAGSDPTVVADPDERRKVCSWMLSRTEDPFGNHILYDYVRDSDVDTLRSPDLPPPSADQTEFHHWDELYLRRIRYVDYDNNGATEYLVSVTFHYEKRPDPFSSYRSGFEIRTRLRCTRIEFIRMPDQHARYAATVWFTLTSALISPILLIFFPHPVAQRTTQWERGDDPMTQFSFTADYDEFGQPQRQTQIACPRGWDTAPKQQSWEFALRSTGLEASSHQHRDRTNRWEMAHPQSQHSGIEVLGRARSRLPDLQECELLSEAGRAGQKRVWSIQREFTHWKVDIIRLRSVKNEST